MKEKCQYCERWIDSYEIRCSHCNFIWGEGFKFGQENIKKRFRNLFKDLMEEDKDGFPIPKQKARWDE